MPPRSLLGWLLASSPGASVRGFTDQRWNGITTLHFARLCAAVIDGVEVAQPQHVVPGDTVTKAELLELAAAAFGATRSAGGAGAWALAVETGR